VRFTALLCHFGKFPFTGKRHRLSISIAKVFSFWGGGDSLFCNFLIFFSGMGRGCVVRTLLVATHARGQQCPTPDTFQTKFTQLGFGISLKYALAM
jgi:hypothetical protein